MTSTVRLATLSGMKLSQLIRRDNSFLLLIDIQERLAPAIDQGRAVIDQNQWLLKIASELSVPVVVTEQYPKGLGHTVADLSALLEEALVLEKTHFSAFAEPAIAERLQNLQRKQVVITGTEAHVCVLQTAIDMQAAGFQVFIVEGAVGSRREQDKKLALERMRQAGCVIVSSEMVAFEWLHKSATDEFRRISKQYIR